MAAIPTPDLAVPYEAPRQVKTIALVQPMAPKKGYMMVSMTSREKSMVIVLLLQLGRPRSAGSSLGRASGEN